MDQDLITIFLVMFQETKPNIKTASYINSSINVFKFIVIDKTVMVMHH